MHGQYCIVNQGVFFFFAVDWDNIQNNKLLPHNTFTIMALEQLIQCIDSPQKSCATLLRKRKDGEKT